MTITTPRLIHGQLHGLKLGQQITERNIDSTDCALLTLVICGLGQGPKIGHFTHKTKVSLVIIGPATGGVTRTILGIILTVWFTISDSPSTLSYFLHRVTDRQSSRDYTHGTDNTMEQHGLDKTVHFVRAVPFGQNYLVKPVRLSEKTGRCHWILIAFPIPRTNLIGTDQCTCHRLRKIMCRLICNLIYIKEYLWRVVGNTVRVTIAWVTTTYTRILLESLSKI